jgi:hypothetical protein
VRPNTVLRLTRRRRVLMIASVAGALVSAGALAGCGDASDPGGAAVQARNAAAPLPLGDAVNPDGNRERVWERAGVRPPVPGRLRR